MPYKRPLTVAELTSGGTEERTTRTITFISQPHPIVAEDYEGTPATHGVWHQATVRSSKQSPTTGVPTTSNAPSHGSRVSERKKGRSANPRSACQPIRPQPRTARYMIARLRPGQIMSAATRTRLEHILASVSKCPHPPCAKTYLQACKCFQTAENASR